MPEAARLHDPIEHSRALGGLVAGAVIGGAVATLVVVTAPVSVPALIGGAAIAGAAVGGAGVGELLGSLSFSRYEAGEIARLGSPNVFINGIRAARAHLDTVECDQHPARPVIAQGSGTVFINGMPAARKGDRTACDAVIAMGSNNVIIGGPTVTTDDISPEVPGFVHATMLAVGLASAAILVGPAAALLGLAGGYVGANVMHAVGAATFGDGSDMDKVLTFGGAMAGGFLGGKGGQWFDRNYSVRPNGLGVNGGGAAIARRVPPAAEEPSNPFLPKKLGEREEGAVPITAELEAARDAAKARTGQTADGYPELPDWAAKTFGEDARPWNGDAETGPIRRVIDADSNPAGGFWQREPLSDEPSWRGGAAVRNDWNGDGGYVEAPPAGLKGWIGPAAPQDASVPGYMLPGSGEQIWLPSNVAKPGAPIATPWNGARSK